MKKYNVIVAWVSLWCVMSCFFVEARYKSKPLKSNFSHGIQNIVPSIFCEFKIFTNKDCKKYFNSKYIIKKGFQPVQITIKNYSAHGIVITPEGFTFPCIDAQIVADSLHRDAVARGLGFGLAGICLPWLFIPAIVESYGAEKFNKDMDQDFACKVLKTNNLAAGSTISGVIFVSRADFTKKFSLTVQDQITNEPIILMPQQVRSIA